MAADDDEGPGGSRGPISRSRGEASRGTAYRPIQTYKLPSHSSKMVLSIVKIGPPAETRSSERDRPAPVCWSGVLGQLGDATVPARCLQGNPSVPPGRPPAGSPTSRPWPAAGASGGPLKATGVAVRLRSPGGGAGAALRVVPDPLASPGTRDLREPAPGPPLALGTV